MKAVQSALIQAEAWMQEELSAQDRMLELLGSQEAAVIAGDTESFRAIARQVEGEIAGGTPRTKRREAILAALGREWSVSPGSLTLKSIARRAAESGLEVERLEGLRSQLREKTALVLRTGRRIAAYAQYHRGLLEELLRTIVDGPSEGGERPVLVDAEA